MSTLHTVNKSPFSHNSLLNCLDICAKSDAILLIEDGVLGAIKNALFEEAIANAINAGVKIYALTEDVKARGLLENLRNDIELSDYSGFVKLTTQHRNVQSWY